MTVRIAGTARQFKQNRARDTRARLVITAAEEFARRGYAAASINAILGDSGLSKGALYWHFPSKNALAHAVLDDAERIYVDIGTRWQSETALHPFAALAGIVDDIAVSFTDNPIMQAEARLSLEPDFYPRIRDRGSRAWETAGLRLATTAQNLGYLEPECTPEKLVRVLATMLAGQRHMDELLPGRPELRDRFAESLETVIAAMAITDHHRIRWTRSTDTI